MNTDKIFDKINREDKQVVMVHPLITYTICLVLTIISYFLLTGIVTLFVD